MKAPPRGAVYEDRACAYLQRQGLTLVARNLRSSYGEIDLIMREADCLVFVEVRARSGQNHGGAVESLTRAKCTKLWKTAQSYLQQHPYSGSVRFDLVAIATGRIEWHKDIIQGEAIYGNLC